MTSLVDTRRVQLYLHLTTVPGLLYNYSIHAVDLNMQTVS